MDRIALHLLLIFALSHIAAAVLTIGLTVYSARNYWEKPIGRIFTGLVGVTTIWIVGSLVRVFATDIDALVVITTIKYIGIATAPVFFFLFALLYGGNRHRVTPKVLGSLFVLPALTLVVVATTRRHELFYSGYSTAAVGSREIVTITAVGPWYWLFVCFSWVLIAIGSGMIVYTGIKRPRLYRLQVLFLVPAILVSWVANLAYVFFNWPHPALDPTPIGFAITSSLLAVGILSTRLVDVAPTARSIVFDAIDEGVIVLDPEGRVVDVNDAAQPLMATDGGIGDPVTDVFSAQIAEAETGSTATIEVTVDSQQRVYRRRRLPIGSDGTQGSIIVLTDVTAEKDSQQRIEQVRAQLRQIVDLIPDPIFAKNLSDEVLISNEANAKLHGMTPAEIEGTREREIESAVENIDDFDKYRQREIGVAETGTPMTFEEELTGPDGEPHVFKTTRIPFETTGSEEDAVLGYARDVTDLKEYEQELEATKERLERTTEELELLNRILRHDIRNDVAMIARRGRQLEAHVDEAGEEYRQQLLDRSDRIEALTTDLRLLMETMLEESRDLEPVRLDVVLERELEDVQATFERATIERQAAFPEVLVRADRMLSSVFQNLLRNAVEHNDQEEPAVTVAVDQGDDCVRVRVADNGPGVPAELTESIFGKGEMGLESKGTGIGLYLVSELVDAYDGAVWVEDNEPRGAVFVVELPTAS